MKTSPVLVISITAMVLAAQTQPAGNRLPSAADIEAVLAQISDFQYGRDPAPTVRLDEMVGKASGSAEMRRTVETLLLKFLQSNATPAGKEAAFRQLSLVGSSASVPVLAPLLMQIDTSEMARYALAAIPGPAVDDALRKALGQAPSDKIRIGLINSLGRRKDTKSVSALASLISSDNLAVTAAAAAALASISDRAALKALEDARKNATGPFRDLLSEATVVCADHFADRGEKAVAVALYKQMIGPGELRPVRIRALKSFGAADPKGAVQTLLAEVQSKDVERQVIGIGLLNRIPGQEVTKALIGEFSKLPPAGQVHLLTALASRGDSSARPIVLSALKSDQPAVQGAALSAVGRLGDGSNVPTLAEFAAKGEEPGQSAARASLYTLRGSNIDNAIIGAMSSASGKVKAELIRAIGERAASSAADPLVNAAQEPDPDVRREALRALRNVGGAAQVPALLDLLLKASSALERRDATLTLATVVRRSQPVPIDKVISAYNAAPSKEVKLGLLDVMGQTSSAQALPILRAGMKDSDPEIARAAILALSGWDTPEPLADLLALAKAAPRPAPSTASAPVGFGGQGGSGRPGAGAPPGGGGGGRGALPPTNNIQILALRGVLRLAVLESKRTPSESGLLLREVMSLATQVPEKRSVLSQLPYFPSKESLEVAQLAINDAAVTNEARVALDQVTEGMKAK